MRFNDRVTKDPNAIKRIHRHGSTSTNVRTQRMPAGDLDDTQLISLASTVNLCPESLARCWVKDKTRSVRTAVVDERQRRSRSLRWSMELDDVVV